MLLNFGRVIESKGGTEKVFFDMSNSLACRDHFVTAIGFENKVGEPFFFVDQRVCFKNIGIGFINRKSLWQKIKLEFLRTFSREKAQIYRNKIEDVLRKKKLDSVIKESDPDVIISYMPRVTRLLKNTLKVDIPVITMFHGAPDNLLEDVSSDEIKALNACDLIQVLMPSYLEQLKKYGVFSNAVYIPNAVQQNIERVDLRKKKNTYKIITVGRVDSVQKRTHLLVEAFAQIPDEIKSNWLIDIYGETNIDIEYYHYCLHLVEKYNLKAQVSFCGITDKVFDKLKDADIFAFPSAFEGMPLAMLEAMSVGLPVVGYRTCCSVNEIIKDAENGFLADDNIDDFAIKLQKLMFDNELRSKLGENAHKAVEEYSPNNVWNKWEDVINSVVNKHKV